MQTTERTGWAIGYVVLSALMLGGVATYARQAAASERAQLAVARRAQAADAGVPDGPAVFRRACNRCHPNGRRDVGPEILNKNLAEARMVKAIRAGTGRMRAISLTKLPEANMPALMAYLRSIHAVR